MYASTMLVAGVKQGGPSFTRTVETTGLDEYKWLELLLDLDVEIIVCGGISPEIAKLLNDYGIQVICNVAGEAEEVLAALSRGELHPWFGYPGHNPPQRPRAFPGQGGLSEDSPALGKEAGIEEEGWFPCSARLGCAHWKPLVQGEQGKSLLVELEARTASGFKQLRELVRQHDYSRVGVVYCAELSGHIPEVLEELNRFIAVYPLACPARCRRRELSSSEKKPEPCSPASQAGIINNAGCDFVIVVGFCPAFHLAFNRLVEVRTAVMVGGSSLELSFLEESVG